MKETSTDSAVGIDRIRSWARTHAHGGSTKPKARFDAGIPLSNTNSAPSYSVANKQDEKDSFSTNSPNGFQEAGSGARPGVLGSHAQRAASSLDNTGNGYTHATRSPESTSKAEESGTIVREGEGEDKIAKSPKPNIYIRFMTTTKKILLHSWINLLLVFAPVGIALANVDGIPAGAVFGINAVAIIPLAGLLSHATESVARKLGDTIGALLNVTFGNAVELIIFIIALVKGEIRIVQASLLGSILANLLLILGMSFFLGGLRFREQIYNSTVTQMSACLLSLSVISLVLPTAFHASFQSNTKADEESLKISRATSIILLLVYIVYLLFQLKSHAYMYESTPQHVIDEEATPGPAALWLETSSSSNSSSDSDSDGSDSSRNTMKRRVKRAIRRRRRKSSVTSHETTETRPGTSSMGTANATPITPGADGTITTTTANGESSSGGTLPRMNTQRSDVSDEVIEMERPKHRRKHHRHSKRKNRKQKKSSSHETGIDEMAVLSGDGRSGPAMGGLQYNDGEPRRVDFADQFTAQDGMIDGSAEGTKTGDKRPVNKLRGLSLRPVAMLAPVFSQPLDQPAATTPGQAGPVPRIRYGIRRTNSLPDRLNETQYRPPGGMFPTKVPAVALAGPPENVCDEEEDDLSHTAAVVMLLVSTGLVAACAEFMVNAINDVVATSGVRETFIGLIILPIVGNAAEHVTAVTVAVKNKMDLAIGVAVGSSIQIALFMTPVVVLLGWMIDQPMTLHFTLFETVCLFVSAFIVNFLVLDGRSNYLEGALLCTTYIIIAIVAGFYPEDEDANSY